MSKKNYVDFSEIYKGINKTEKQLEKSMRNAVIEAGEYSAKELAKRTPEYRGINQNKEHAKDHVVMSKPTPTKPYSEVGFDKKVAWRVHFIEFGTIKQRPKPFIKRTIESIESQVADIIQREMMKGLKK